MKVFSDFHIHSKYSRATSRSITIHNLVKYAKIKGLNLLGTGDFTHPLWLKELKESLKEDGTGILKDEEGFGFVLQAEISNIYSQGGKLRKIHNVILAPGFEVVDQINEFLGKHGKLEADGRPIFGKMSCAELVENLTGISSDVTVVPAHVWTPWFGVFGSKSGFDSIRECFQDQSKHIHALETGLSSDPAMNWRLSKLDKYALVSNSDSHSYWPWRIGREANVMELPELTYGNFTEAMKGRNPDRFLYTIEVDPSYGKYHLDGHRNCGVVMEPQESVKNRDVCPRCGRPLTIGVLHRVEELADRPEGFVPENAVPFKSVIPLSEIIASLMKTQPSSRAVWTEYTKIVNSVGSEFGVLLEAGFDELKSATNERIADAIMKIRESKIRIQPGYDGEYGYPVFEGSDIPETPQAKIENRQKSLADFTAR
jgi:uncharacterized protein (TIGR00375 family)